MGTISVPENMDAADVVTDLRLRQDVRFAELDRVRTISGIADQDPGYASQWNMRQIGTEAAWDSGYDGSGIVVAVIDTGVSDGGADGLYLTSGEQAGWDFVGDDPDPSDAHGHGTHVAGRCTAHRKWRRRRRRRPWCRNQAIESWMPMALDTVPTSHLESSGRSTTARTSSTSHWAQCGLPGRTSRRFLCR